MFFDLETQRLKMFQTFVVVVVVNIVFEGNFCLHQEYILHSSLLTTKKKYCSMTFFLNSTIFSRLLEYCILFI